MRELGVAVEIIRLFVFLIEQRTGANDPAAWLENAPQLFQNGNGIGLVLQDLVENDMVEPTVFDGNVDEIADVCLRRI